MKSERSKHREIKYEISFLIKGSRLDKETEIVSGETSIRKALENLVNNWDSFGIDQGTFGKIESLRVISKELS